LKDRALTLKRYPDGVDGPFFYEKRCPPHRPSWVKTAAIWSEGNNADINFCLANDLPTLVGRPTSLISNYILISGERRLR
jgi:bifunctional non-homologous end joining protein LigD